MKVIIVHQYFKVKVIIYSKQLPCLQNSNQGTQNYKEYLKNQIRGQRRGTHIKENKIIIKK